MQIMRSSIKQRFLVVATLGVLATWAIGVQAVDPQDPAKDGKAKPVAAPIAVKPAEKLITFNCNNKPWNAVLEWLADQTGMPVSSLNKPTGTFTFIVPPGHSGKYTLPQIIDILNDNLVDQKLILIRRDQTFRIIAAEEKIDPSILPRILPEDLDKRGNTELVSVILPLKSLNAEDFATTVEKM